MVDEDKFEISRQLLEYMELYDDIEYALFRVQQYWDKKGYPVTMNELNELIQEGLI